MPSINGQFEEADGGTLFLDEIGDMPADMQVKLLRVLEERSGAAGRRQAARSTVDVRIVAATHRDIDAAIDAGAFREDLFYRLAVFPIDLPSLAERRERPAAAGRSFPRTDARSGARRASPRPRYARLAEHGWPGNVRELRNFVERATILFAGRTIGADEAGALLLRRGRVGAAERAALWPATERCASRREPVAEIVPIRAEIDIAADGRDDPRRAGRAQGHARRDRAPLYRGGADRLRRRDRRRRPDALAAAHHPDREDAQI